MKDHTMSAGIASFWNGSLARILMIIVAISLAVLAWFQFENIKAQKAQLSEISPATDIANLESSDAIEKCMAFRFASIDQSVVDGFMAEAEVESAKAAVRSLCISQTRGQSF